MADIKISALPAASQVNASDQFEVNQGGTSRRITAEQLRAFPLQNKDADYTLVLADAFTTINRNTGAGAFTYTIPPNASVAFPVGTRIRFSNILASTTVAIAPGASVVLRYAGVADGTRTLAAGGLCEVQKIATNTWVLMGSGLT